MTPPAAVVDLGSNSVRLLAARDAGDERTTTITALRRGAADDGTLTEEALQRLDACLGAYAARIADIPRAHRLVIATSATRDAPNGHRVAELVEAHIGPLRVLSGDEEARMAFRGARLALDEGTRCVMVDIGGGSTELVRGGPDGVDRAISVQLGASRGTDRWLVSDPPSAGEVASLDAEAGRLLAEAVAAIGGPLGPGEIVLGVAGTITTLAAIALGGYDPVRVHGARLDREQIAGLVERLAGLAVAERSRIPGLEPARAPVIVAGAVAAQAVCRALAAEVVVVSERDILDGALMTLRDELGAA